MSSFSDALTTVGLLDRFQIAGTIAGWWNEVQYDLKALSAGGFAGVLEGWVTTILTALEDDSNKASPLDHKLVRRLLPDLLEEIASQEARIAELDGQIKAGQPAEGEEEDAEPEEAEALGEEELKALKKQLNAAKKQLKALKQGFATRLKAAHTEQDVTATQGLVLGILRDDLLSELEQKVAAQRQAIVAEVENWWDKYRVTLREVETARDLSAMQLGEYLRVLDYA